MDSGPESFVHGASVLDARVCPCEGGMWAFPSYIADIVSPFVGPSVGLLVEKLSHVRSDLNEDGEESEIHPLVKNLDDTSKYVPIRRVTKERVLALPTQFEDTVMNPLSLK